MTRLSNGQSRLMREICTVGRLICRSNDRRLYKLVLIGMIRTSTVIATDREVQS